MVEILLTGGTVNSVSRRGNVVLKNSGPWTPTIQNLLRHLEGADFTFSPSALGTAEDGREVLSLLPGESMLRPWSDVMLNGSGLEQIGAMVRLLHDATRSLVLPATTVWRAGEMGKSEGQVIRHGDLGPWNMLWTGEVLSGLVDWDLAEPGNAITDLAQVAWYCVPLRGDSGWQESGFKNRPDYEGRIEAICRGYGAFSILEVLQELDRLQNWELTRTRRLAAMNVYPWSQWLADDEIAEWKDENTWLHQEFESYLLRLI